MRFVIVAFVLMLAAAAQAQDDVFAGVQQIEWAVRARDVFKHQRDEAVEKYTNAEIALGILASENRKLKAKITELEKQVKPAEPAVEPEATK